MHIGMQIRPSSTQQRYLITPPEGTGEDTSPCCTNKMTSEDNLDHLWLELKDVWEVRVQVLCSTEDIQDIYCLRAGDVL